MADWTSAIIGGVVGAVIPALGATWALSAQSARFEAHMRHEIGGSGGTIPSGVVVASLKRCDDLGAGWETYDTGAGRMIVGVGTATVAGFDRTFNLEEKDGYYSHVLLTEELPSHSHYLPTDTVGSTDIQSLMNSREADEGIGPGSIASGVTGGGKPHNNMPPYIALYYCEKG